MFNPLYGRSAQRTKQFKALPGSQALDLRGPALLAAAFLFYACAPLESQKSTPGNPAPSKPKAWHVSTFAGGGPADADGIGTAAGFNLPYGIAQIGDTLYVTDRNANSLRTIDISTAAVGTLGGGASTGLYNRPSGAAAAGSKLYFTDSSKNHIRQVSLRADGTPRQVITFAGSGIGMSGDADSVDASALFNLPHGLAISGDMLYVADSGNHRIRAVNLTNKDVTTIAGSSRGYKDDAGSAAQFDDPRGLAVSGDTLYVADSGNHRIRAVNLTNKDVTTIAGSSRGYKDDAGSAAQFDNPRGLAVSGSTLYVADHGNHRIRAVDLASADKAVTTIAGNGTPGSRDGIGTAAQVHSPLGIAVSGSTLYVTSGKQIRKIEYREVDS